jgi:hypothetical protein
MGMFSTILFAVLSSNYADQIQTDIAYLDLCGLELVAGPSMGGILYYIGDHSFLGPSHFLRCIYPAVCLS